MRKKEAKADPMKVIFMGTPEFAVSSLKALVENHDVLAVVTQPDRPKGRGKELQVTPVKKVAIKHSIPVFQPVKIREKNAILELEKYPADVMVVIAFGQILPRAVLEMTPYGCINVHASLLPAYRGAAPIQWCIINGDEVTGITTMQMDEGLDTGDMILKEEIPISSEETAASLHDKLAKIGASLCVKTLQEIEKGTATFKKQKETTTEYAKMLTKDMGRIDWEKSAIEIERWIRGLNSWPGAYTYLRDKEIKIWRGRVVENCANQGSYLPGEIIRVDKSTTIIQTGKGQLEILEIQLSGKKKMTIDAFLRGNKLEIGERFN